MSDGMDIYRKLRNETASLLGFDLSNLSASQALKLDLTTTLRLEFDSLQGQQLSGQPIDFGRLLIIAEKLEALLPKRESDLAPPRRIEDDPREQLRRLIMKQVEAHQFEEAREIDVLRAENETLRQTIRSLRGEPPPSSEPKALPPPTTVDEPPRPEAPSPKPFVNGIQPREVERTFLGTEPWRPYVTGHGGVPDDLYWGGAWGRRSW
jgi:hypothetical protein